MNEPSTAVATVPAELTEAVQKYELSTDGMAQLTTTFRPHFLRYSELRQKETVLGDVLKLLEVIQPKNYITKRRKNPKTAREIRSEKEYKPQTFQIGLGDA